MNKHDFTILQSATIWCLSFVAAFHHLSTGQGMWACYAFAIACGAVIVGIVVVSAAAYLLGEAIFRGSRHLARAIATRFTVGTAEKGDL